MNKEQKIERMKELVKILSEASYAYYAKDEEIISNFEYDRLYDELESLEKECDMVLVGSPTLKVGYEAVDELPKEKHAAPMLSLGKTKEREELRSFLGEQKGLLSWKLDGLTVVLTYEKGELVKAVTRGNGEVGEVVTNNARFFKNIPLKISYEGTLVIRGEAVIGYEDFERINAKIEEPSLQFKNPRNLCSGSVRQLNNQITAERHVRFFAFSLVEAEGVDFKNSRKEQMEFLRGQGFDVVEYKEVTADNILEGIEYFADAIASYDIPSDGLVLIFDDIAYGRSLGRTAKFPRDAIAFKWADEVKETILKEIEWSPSRTGLINPVAIFEPVELEGTTVSRASVHNISVMRALKLGIGDRITVYKANMIIPQIADNLTGSDSVEIPCACPVCGEKTEIQAVNEVQTLYCVNPECPVKKIKALTLFVSRDALNMDGLSEATLEKFVAEGFIRDYKDLFRLERYREQIIAMEGFGEKSYDNLIASIETARNTTLPRLVYALGIANIGVAMAKVVCKHFDYDLEAMRVATEEEVSQIEGIGDVIAGTFCSYFRDMVKMQSLDELLQEVVLEKPEASADADKLKGKTFVVTGSVNHFNGRSELKEIIENMGGKVAGSVSAKTECLINNDTASTSSKNKKAKELNIPILSEEDFMEKYGVEGTV
ncbi:MAG: NAD-dependent DNA ligase LigA [Lachnospiraceae bacterium]|nr:NAD-dependent DNA ligase LigA [Lachnospiraceae bacterium]